MSRLEPESKENAEKASRAASHARALEYGEESNPWGGLRFRRAAARSSMKLPPRAKASVDLE